MNPVQIEGLIERLERLSDPEAREAARDLMGQLLQVQGEALARLVELTRAVPGGQGLLASWLDDPKTAGLLLLHGLHPDTPAVRVAKAMESMAAVAEFVGVETRTLRVGSMCVIELNARGDVPAHALKELQEQMESAIVAAAPEVETVRFEVTHRMGLPLVGGRHD